MKQSDYRFFVPGAAACILLATQPVLAQITQVTDVQLNPIQGGISVILRTGNENSPQVLSTRKGKSLVANIVNAQLRLPKGGNFRQENPAPGIAVIEIKQLDTNNMQVTVTGTDNAPNIQPVNRRDNNITLGFTTTVANSTTSNSTNSTDKPGQQPEVLVPNPQVTIDGKITQTPNPGQAYKQSPVFLPKAVAPPVGDITQSNIDTSPVVINLGTKERVRRLVLRDAPVREVLSLLARAAGLNLAYIGDDDDKDQKTPASSTGDNKNETETKIYQKISLDVENEAVQDVFNYVLRLSGLEANRSGRTIFVGPKLPNSTRDVVMRNLRLNQADVKVVASFLVRLGAESALNPQVQTTRTTITSSENTEKKENTETKSESEIRAERIVFKDSVPLLRGLQVLGDERTNTLTLIGSPKLVEMAVSQLTQLDIRRRQVVVNVKIIDVNLTGTQDYNTSFSFGVGNNFFVNDGGAASLNFGGSRPATGSEVKESVTQTPVIKNPITGAPFFDANSTFTVPNGGSGLRIIRDGLVLSETPPGDATFLRPISPTNTSPTTPGISNFTPGTPDVITITTDPTTGRQTAAFAEGSRAASTFALPSLYQFPKRFLASLQAQVTKGNAKILTDPTLIVQEGQTADVQLTQQVVGDIKITRTDTPGGSREEKNISKEPVGLSLSVKIERIDDNGFVSLQVAPNVKSPVGTADTGNGKVILVSTRSLTSGTIRLRDTQTLILSGIIQDEDRTSVSKLPILGDIPLLGALFRKTNKVNERREVIILLTPQIMDDSQNSGYGYNYTPSPTAREMLERQGVKLQPR
jgi:type IV pilus assembly protein PilQ